MNVVRQGSWVIASRIAAQLAGVALLIVSARFLAPDALGGFIIIFAGIELLRRIVGAGWCEYVIAADDQDEAVRTVMPMALILGIASLMIVAAVASWLAFGTELPSDYPILLFLLGLTLIPRGLMTVWEGVLLRNQKAASAAKALIAAEALHILVAGVLLSLEWGLLALAAARIARSTTMLAGLGWASGWPFALGWNGDKAFEAAKLSAHITSSSLINYASTYGVDFIVGAFLGPASVAFYRIGARIAGAVSEVVSETSRVLAWSVLPPRDKAATVRAADLAANVEEFFSRVLLLAAPVYVGLALIAGNVVALLLGPEWAPTATVVAILALARMFQMPVIVAWPTLTLLGKTKYLPRLTAVILVLFVIMLALLAPFGLEAVAGSQLFAAMISGAGVFYLLMRVAELSGRRVLGAILDALAGVVLMSVAILLLKYFITLPFEGMLKQGVVIATEAVCGAIVYISYLWVRRPELLKEIAAQLQKGALKQG